MTNYDDESSSSSSGNLDELLCQPDDSHHSNNDGGDTRAVRRVHRAALTFRHAIHSLGFQSKFLASHHDDYGSTDNNNGDDNDKTISKPTSTTTSLYEGYIQTHTMMKLTNLRAKTLHDNSSPLQLCQQSCTQTWPGQLSLVDNNNDDEVAHNTVVTCLNSAEVWCDHPSCKHARCGPNGLCLRAYRFLPSSSVVVGPHNNRQRDVRRTNVGDLNGPGDINGTWRQRQQQHAHATTTTNDWNTNLSFVKCNWCSVSYCNEHIADYRKWYKCDECELSSCLQCTSQVFPTTTMMYYPPIQICNVMTAGKKCGRRICSNCIWFVGKECTSSSSSSQQEESVIPGGKVITDYNVVSIKARGDDVNNDEKRSSGGGGGSNSSVSNRERIQQLIEKEMCCSKCLRHVEFRWRELSVVIDMFDGFVP